MNPQALMEAMGHSSPNHYELHACLFPGAYQESVVRMEAIVSPEGHSRKVAYLPRGRQTMTWEYALGRTEFQAYFRHGKSTPPGKKTRSWNIPHDLVFCWSPWGESNSRHRD